MKPRDPDVAALPAVTPARLHSVPDSDALPPEAISALEGPTAPAAELTPSATIPSVPHRSYSELESRVARRTAQLDLANKKLRGELNERLAAEAALSESEQKFRCLVQSANEAILVCDSHSTVIDCNRAVEVLFGFTPQEIIGQPIALLLSTSARQTAQDEFVRLINQMGLDNSRRVFEVAALRHDGSQFPVEMSVAVWQSGESCFFSAIMRDISVRFKREREIRSRVRQQEAVAELGRQALAGRPLQTMMDGAVALICAALDVESSTIMEMWPEEEEFVLTHAVGAKASLIGRYRVSQHSDTLASYVLKHLDSVIVHDLDRETRFVPPPVMVANETRSVISVPIMASGALFGILGAQSMVPQRFDANDLHVVQSVANILSTVIERNRAQELLEAAREEAESANVAKSEFLSRMSHELRTPLNAILGFGQILEMQPLPPLQSESVMHIMKAGRHLLELVNEVLDITRVETGRLELSNEPVHLSAVVTDTLNLLRPIATSGTIEMFESVSLTHPAAYVWADQRRLRQVLLNLVGNAIKYNRARGKVVVACRASEEGRLRLEVADTGPGLAPEDIDKLFVPFERLGAASSEIEGTGLGLTLSKRLAESMGGSLGVNSTVGQGSTFYVDLSICPAPVKPSLEPAEAAVLAAVASPQARTLLYIEDNLSNFRLVQAILDDQPHIRVMGASQGRLGVELARHHLPDIILLDLHLPDIDGREVLLRLWEDPATRSVPVIMLTADVTPSKIERPLLEHVHAHLTKPLDVAGFLKVLQETLDPV